MTTNNRIYAEGDRPPTKGDPMPDRAKAGSAQTRPAEVVARKATTNTTPMISRTGGGAPAKLNRRRIQIGTLPIAFASVYSPVGRRHLWAFAYCCPRCGFGHLGRADTEQAINGRRHRGSCGRSVVVKIARVYRGPQQDEAVS